MTEPFVLDPYAARTCELKTAYAFTPGLIPPAREFPPPPFFHDADAVEADVFGRLIASDASTIDLRGLRNTPSAEQEQAALAAMDSGVDVIIGPLLPRDWDAHRAGRPSLLVRRGDGYAPVLVKFHRVLESGSLDGPPLLYSTLDEPLLDREESERRYRWSSRLTAALQAAHHWRLLEATGRAASTPMAGLIGTERLSPADAPDRRQHLVITWLDLAAPMAAPSPGSVADPGAALPISALARYDAEHAHRVALAEGAASGAPGWEPPLPVIHRACAFCVWQEHCASRLRPDDLSLRIAKAPLDPHEVKVLRSLGVASVDDLAALDLDAFLPDYLPRVSHRELGDVRLRTAQRRARMFAAGVELERTSTGPIVVPEHDLEIDLDIETSAEDRAYLWGFLLHDRAAGSVKYRAFARFTDLDAADERDLAAEAFAWLRNLTEGRDAVVYHYSDFETLRVHKIAEALRGRREGPVGLPDWMDALASRHFVDLFSLVRGHFFGADGLGLKIVASAGAGFSWRDAEPGGLASQRWFADAVSAETPEAREAARVRVLEYNEDDVRATWHLRRWLRSLT